MRFKPHKFGFVYFESTSFIDFDLHLLLIADNGKTIVLWLLLVLERSDRTNETLIIFYLSTFNRCLVVVASFEQQQENVDNGKYPRLLLVCAC